MVKRQFINRIDEQDRFRGLEVYLIPEHAPNMQRSSHGFSYKAARDLFKEAEEVMGLDYTDITKFYRK